MTILMNLFNIFGLSVWRILPVGDNETFKIVISKIGIISGISVFTFTIYCQITSSNTVIPAYGNLSNFGVSNVANMFIILIHMTKIPFIFIPIWVYAREKKIFHVKITNCDANLRSIQCNFTVLKIISNVARQLFLVLIGYPIYFICVTIFAAEYVTLEETPFLTWQFAFGFTAPLFLVFISVIQLITHLTFISDRFDLIRSRLLTLNK